MEPMKVSSCFATPAVGMHFARHTAPSPSAVPLRVDLKQLSFKVEVTLDDSDGASDSTTATHLQSLSSRERSLTPRSEYGDSRIGSCDLAGVDRLPTTVIMRNIPNRFSRSMLLSLLDDSGFGRRYDMVYLPHDLAKQMAFGYAFLNFTAHAVAQRFISEFNGFASWGRQSGKVCSVGWSEAQDDLDDHVRRYRDCAMMHEAVPDEFKPAIFANGMRLSFPPPTKRLRKPRAYLLKMWAASPKSMGAQEGHCRESELALALSVPALEIRTQDFMCACVSSELLCTFGFRFGESRPKPLAHECAPAHLPPL